MSRVIWQKPVDVLSRWIWAGWPSSQWSGLRDDTPGTLGTSSPELTASTTAETACCGSPGGTGWETRCVTQIFHGRGYTKNCGSRLAGGDGEMSQEDSKSGAETCDGVIEQSNGRKNRRKGQAKKRKSCFFHSELLLVIHNRNRGNDIYTPASCWPSRSLAARHSDTI